MTKCPGAEEIVPALEFPPASETAVRIKDLHAEAAEHLLRGAGLLHFPPRLADVPQSALRLLAPYGSGVDTRLGGAPDRIRYGGRVEQRLAWDAPRPQAFTAELRLFDQRGACAEPGGKSSGNQAG